MIIDFFLFADDQFRIEQGEEKQHYDAFLLYADEDQEFAKIVIKNLEDNNLKVILSYFLLAFVNNSKNKSNIYKKTVVFIIFSCA